MPGNGLASIRFEPPINSLNSRNSQNCNRLQPPQLQPLSFISVISFSLTDPSGGDQQVHRRGSFLQVPLGTLWEEGHPEGGAD